MVIKILAGIAILCLVLSVVFFVKGIRANREWKRWKEQKQREAEKNNPFEEN